MYELFGVVAAEALAVVYEEVGNLDGLVGMQGCLFVLVHLGKQGTDLHMRFAFVFEHFKLEGGLVGIVEEVLNEFTREVRQTLLKRHSTLLEHP